jgi:hypothetical protein
MADYQDIKGLRVKYLSADPSNTAAGEVWYNSTTGTLKSHLLSSAWVSSASMTNARNSIVAAGLGTQASALVVGGGGGPGDQANTEEYNGSGWAAGGDLGTARRDIGATGTQTSALAFGGQHPVTNLTEEYDGTTWTAQNVLGTARRSAAGAGTQTAGLAIGGSEPGVTTATEEYNGASWAAGGVLGTARDAMAAGGPQTAAIGFGGSPATTKTEEYNGTGWTEVNDMNTVRTNMAGDGPQTAALGGGGYLTPGLSNATETFDGTDWATSPATLGTARSGCGGAGSSPAFVLFGGDTPPTVAITEEFTQSINVLTAASWAAGAAFPTDSSSLGGCGTKTAGLAVGGYPEGNPPTGKSFEYNGTAWVNEAALSPNTLTQGGSGAVFGTQAAAVACMYNTPAPPFVYKATCEYDGSAWANAEDRPADNYSQAVAGILTAGLNFGGSPGNTDVTLEYDGTNWSIVPGTLGTGRSEMGGAGTQTAALGAGGYSTPPATTYDVTEEYNGASWTTSPATMLTATRGLKLSGTQTDSLAMAGGTASFPYGTVDCSRYDGTAWATSPSMATGRLLFGNSSGAVGEAFGAAGYYPGSSPNRTTTVEVFSVETSAANIETLTTS